MRLVNTVFKGCFIGFLIFSISAVSAAEESASSGFFKNILDSIICGPGGKMCDQTYNPNAKNAMIESPEQLLQYIDNANSYLNNRSAEPVKRSAAVVVPSKSVVAVTASPPSKLNPPLDNDAFEKALKGNSGLGSTIQGYMQKQKSSLPSLKIYAEQGDPFAQLFLGLAYSDDWTGMAEPAESCRWIREAGTAGVSSARYFMAQRAFAKSSCFSEIPTLDQSKIWAELASQSNEQSIKKDSQNLMQDILKLQIAGSK
jgi:hypothetical protein